MTKSICIWLEKKKMYGLQGLGSYYKYNMYKCKNLLDFGIRKCETHIIIIIRSKLLDPSDSIRLNLGMTGPK